MLLRVAVVTCLLIVSPQLAARILLHLPPIVSVALLMVSPVALFLGLRLLRHPLTGRRPRAHR